MFLSFLRRTARRLIPIDQYTAQGKPRPIGRKGKEAGVWLARSLSDANAVGYFVGSGKSLLTPVAICVGTSRADFKAAKAIAADWNKVTTASDNWYDIRNRDLADRACAPPFELVFFPTDRQGRARNDGHHFGSMFQRGNQGFPGVGVITALVPPPHGIPWGFLPFPPVRPLPAGVPCVTLDIDCGWTPVPAALKDHLDRIDPMARKQKSGTSVEPITSTPASNEGEKAGCLTPA